MECNLSFSSVGAFYFCSFRAPNLVCRGPTGFQRFTGRRCVADVFLKQDGAEVSASDMRAANLIV